MTVSAMGCDELLSPEQHVLCREYKDPSFIMAWVETSKGLGMWPKRQLKCTLGVVALK